MSVKEMIEVIYGVHNREYSLSLPTTLLIVAKLKAAEELASAAEYGCGRKIMKDVAAKYRTIKGTDYD